ncbi:MAG: M16 family metallopeptidase, partial [Bacteroidota bacterium]
WLKLRPLAYTRHPYQWATIGKEIRHIEEATLEQVKSFFKAWYRPDNAILCLAGAIHTDEALELVKKWFGPIPSGEAKKRELPAEPAQTSQRRLVLQRDVPASHIYMAFHCCARRDSDFYATDLLSDILSRGKSSRLYMSLVKDKQLFTEIGAYMLGDFDKSLFVVEGKLVHGVEVDKAEDAIFAELNRLAEGIRQRELDKVKHKAEASFRFSEMGVASKALNLCYFELLGDANESNLQPERYNAVTEVEILHVAKAILRPENCSILHYLSTQHA